MALVVPVAQVGVVEAEHRHQHHDAEVDEGEQRVDRGGALDTYRQEQRVDDAQARGDGVGHVAEGLVHTVAGHQTLREVADRPTGERVHVAAPGARH